MGQLRNELMVFFIDTCLVIEVYNIGNFLIFFSNLINFLKV